MSIDTLTEATKDRIRRNAKAWNWPQEYLVTNFVTRIDKIKQAYGKEYQGRESHIILKAYQGIEKMVKDCTPEQFSERFPYGKFPELYRNHPRY